MNREIKSRGKAIDGLWEYGSLWIDKGKYYINGTDNNWWEVIPETVGQFTGLKDKNGKEIYEGDIIRLHQFLFDGSEYEKELIGVVSFKESTAAYGVIEIKHTEVNQYMGFEDNKEAKDNFVPICLFYGLHDESFGIIGNIHENPELLEGKMHE